MDIMGLKPGSVTPFGVLNDDELRVKVFFDSAFGGLIGVHPNDNTATVWLNINDLADIIRRHGNSVEFTQI